MRMAAITRGRRMFMITVYMLVVQVLSISKKLEARMAIAWSNGTL